MIQIAEYLPPRYSPLWDLVAQCGVTQVVGALGFETASADDPPWSYPALLRIRNGYEDRGFQLAVIESRPPLTRAKLGLAGRDEEIDTVCELLDNMGTLGIPVWCYEWMAVLNWTRTSTTIRSRGGALVTGYDHSQMVDAPLTDYGEVSEDQLWENLHYFLEKVLPVAESAGVKLAMHPDDPPLSPIRGLGRIMRNVENFARLLALVPSPMNGIALCQGNFTLMTDDLPALIRRFGDKIFFVHMRDVAIAAQPRTSRRPSMTPARPTWSPACAPTAISASTACSAPTTSLPWPATTTITPATRLSDGFSRSAISKAFARRSMARS